MFFISLVADASIPKVVVAKLTFYFSLTWCRHVHARDCHGCGLPGSEFPAWWAKEWTCVRHDDLLEYLEDSPQSGGFVRCEGGGGMAAYRYGQEFPSPS